MRNSAEKNIVCASLAGMCGAGAVVAVLPSVVGYVLLGVVLLGVLALLVAGLIALHVTRYRPPESKTAPVEQVRREVA